MQSLKNQIITTYDKILAPSILNFLSDFPELQATMLLVYGFFGVVMQYKQNEINDFIQILIDNPGTFTAEIVKTKEFQDGFLIIFEEYLKERNEYKRKGIKNILLGFTTLSEEEKKSLELERILNTLKLINENEINVLSLYNLNEIKSSANPILILFGQLKTGKPLKLENFKLLLNTEFDSQYNGYSNNDILELLNGLVNLNLLLSKTGGTYDYDGDELYIISTFGKKFISYILENDS